MQIQKNTVVTLHYKLQEDDAQGEMVEETFGSEPLVFLYGVGQMIPEFERQLSGKSSGQSFAFGIQADDAYGPVDPDAIISLPLDVFAVDGQIDSDMLEIGSAIPMKDEDGNELVGNVVEVLEDEVVMDFNHPMAGINLYFTGHIESVREATASEIDHGHVH
jgi:FKBP-type peptidyl-prolyl cis-trans isomerase SlyD